MPKYIAFWSQDGQEAVRPTVYYRTNWDDVGSEPWIEVPNVVTLSATKGVQGNIPVAQLRYDFGDMMMEDESSFSATGPLDLLGTWIKIEWTPNSGGVGANYDFAVADESEMLFGDVYVEDGQTCLRLDLNTLWNFEGGTWTEDVSAPPESGTETWYGVVTDEAFDNRAIGGLTGADSGTQVLTCQGPGWFLTRQQISETVFLSADGSTYERLPGTIPFNDNRGDADNKLQNRGNRNDTEFPGPSGQNSFVFSRTFEFGQGDVSWTSEDIINYLFAHFQPFTFAEGNGDKLYFELDLPYPSALAWNLPAGYDPYGKTLLEIIADVIPSDRGFTWWFELEEQEFGGSSLKLKVDTMFSDTITDVTNAASMAPNQNQVDWNYLNDPTTVQGVDINSRQQKYSKVIVEGARRGTVCTMGVRSGELVQAWTTGEEADYTLGGVGEPDYPPSTERAKQQAFNDQFLGSNQDMRRVYTTFKIDPNWNGRTFDGYEAPSSSDQYVLPTINESYNAQQYADGNLVLESSDDVITTEDGSDGYTGQGGVDGEQANSPFNPSTIKFENFLPLFAGFDYQTPETPGGGLSAGQAPEFREPLAYTGVLDPDDQSPDNGKVVPIEQIGSYFDLETREAGAGATANGKLRLGSSGHHLSIESSAPPHYFSAGAAGGTEFIDFPTGVAPYWDYYEHSVTVYITFPERVRGSVTLESDTTSNHYSELLIKMGDKIHLDYIVEGTTVDIQGTQTVPVLENGYVRDDRQLLRDTLQAAAEWYLTDRKSIELRMGTISSLPVIGNLVNDVVGPNGTVEANSVVTSVVWDFLRQSTKTTTSFLELQFGG
jgi:hypothetical protein